MTNYAQNEILGSAEQQNFSKEEHVLRKIRESKVRRGDFFIVLEKRKGSSDENLL